jgi:hypothetical protein
VRTYYWLLCSLSLVALSASCGGGAGVSGAAPSLQGGSLAAGVDFAVLPATFTEGGSGRISAQTAPTPDGGLAVEVRADAARGLKGLFVQLSYDPAQWHPAGASASGTLATGSGSDAGDLLQVSGSAAPRRFEAGQVLAHPQAQAGFSGSGVLAILRLAPGPGPLSERIASQAGHSAGSPDPGWDSPHVELALCPGWRL